MSHGCKLSKISEQLKKFFWSETSGFQQKSFISDFLWIRMTSFSLSVQIQITSSYMSAKENHYANIPPTVCWTHLIKPHSRLDGSYAFRILIWEQCFSIMSDLIKPVTREVTHVQKTSRGAGFDFSKKKYDFSWKIHHEHGLKIFCLTLPKKSRMGPFCFKNWLLPWIGWW